MTSLIAWTGYDGTRPASVYLASDSRLTWPDGSRWDHGRKLFASQSRPEILAYCGEVLFPSQVLGQVIAAIDGGALDECPDANNKRDAVHALIDDSFAEYPQSYRGSFEVLYCTRTGSGPSSEMHCFEIASGKSGSGMTSKLIPMPKSSGVVAIRGSGCAVIKKWTDYWFRSGQAGGVTSRGAFAGFCDAIASKEDLQSGGAVQLVGLFRKGEAKTFGVCLLGSSSIYGLALRTAKLPNTEWRNESFERCNQAGVRLLHAQPQPRPKDIPTPRSESRA